jgi:hypothetical protein
VGVHEWCKIRLIRPQGRLASCEESCRIWYSWAPFWLLFGEAKSDKRNCEFLFLGLHPKPPNFLTRCCLLFFDLVDCCAVVLKQKVSKKFKAYDAFTTIYRACLCRAIQAISLRYISGLLTKPNPQTVTLIVT